jgi:hypothetical protein
MAQQLMRNARGLYMVKHKPHGPHMLFDWISQMGMHPTKYSRISTDEYAYKSPSPIRFAPSCRFSHNALHWVQHYSSTSLVLSM